MVNPDLFLSDAGLRSLKEDEGEINGLYDDPSSYCTFGVGHLVHSAKWSCFLLEAASGDQDWTSFVQKRWPGTSYEVQYLDRGAATSADFSSLKEAAVHVARESLAQSRHGQEFKNLGEANKRQIQRLAEDAVAEEARLLALTVDGVLKADVAPFEAAVRKGLDGRVAISQQEFDALISFAFNVGVANFNNSTLLKKINQNAHRSGDAATRKAAINAIEREFLRWNRSGRRVLEGLSRRRQSEADRFLERARGELANLEGSGSNTSGPDVRLP